MSDAESRHLVLGMEIRHVDIVHGAVDSRGESLNVDLDYTYCGPDIKKEGRILVTEAPGPGLLISNPAHHGVDPSLFCMNSRV